MSAYRNKVFGDNMCELSSWILFSIRSELLQMIRVDEMLFVLPAVFAFLSVINNMFFSLSCSARNEMQTEMGSSVKDVTCRRERYGLIISVDLTSLFYIIIIPVANVLK